MGFSFATIPVCLYPVILSKFFVIFIPKWPGLDVAGKVIPYKIFFCYLGFMVFFAQAV